MSRRPNNNVSAGVLLFRKNRIGDCEVFLAHPGGPFLGAAGCRRLDDSKGVPRGRRLFAAARRDLKRRRESPLRDGSFHSAAFDKRREKRCTDGLAKGMPIQRQFAAIRCRSNGRPVQVNGSLCLKSTAVPGSIWPRDVRRSMPRSKLSSTDSSDCWLAMRITARFDSNFPIVNVFADGSHSHGSRGARSRAVN